MGSSAATLERTVRIGAATDQRQLPDWLNARLRLGARRAERLRADIAGQAGLPTLPAIEIFPEVWRVNGELVLGRTGVIERDSAHLGVLLPGPATVQSDDDLLRCILVRQFCDCISRLARAATQTSAVRAPTSLVDPALWFSPDDALRVKSWVGVRIDGLEVLSGLLAKSLPTAEPPPDDKIVEVHVPDWVRARVALGQTRPSSAWSVKDGQL